MLTRLHSSSMCTARSLTVSHSIRLGGLPNPPDPQADPPGCRPPRQTPLDADPPRQTHPWMETPLCRPPSPGCRPPSPGCKPTQTDPPPLDADPPANLPPHRGQKEWHTLVKTLPSRKAGGNNTSEVNLVSVTADTDPEQIQIQTCSDSTNALIFVNYWRRFQRRTTRVTQISAKFLWIFFWKG